MSKLRVGKPLAKALLISIFVLSAFFSVTYDYAFADDNEPVVVSFGDSYSSGEGNDPFYGQDSKDKYVDEDWLAHRSEASWPGRLQVNGTIMNEVKYSQNKNIEANGAKWFFYASSGAVAVNVYNKELASRTEIITRNGKNKYKYAQSKTGNKNLIGESFSEYVEIQLEEAQKDLKANVLDSDDVDYVTMTIGGNDVNFTGIVTSVALRNGFIDRDYLKNALNKAWYDFEGKPKYGTLKFNLGIFEKHDENYVLKRDRIRDCYSSIRKEFGPETKIIVAGYPTLMNDDKWEKYLESIMSVNPIRHLLSRSNMIEAAESEVVGFADWEAYLVNENVRDFNSAIKLLVNDQHDSNLIFVSVEEAFDGHEAYTDEPYLNGIMLPKQQDLTGYGASSYSFHPNYNGESFIDSHGNNVLNDSDYKPVSGVGAYAHTVQQVIKEFEGTTESASTPRNVEHSKSNVGVYDYHSVTTEGHSESSTNRDIALVLDVSGSMAGEPLDATKNAASRFVSVALDNGAQTALVAYDDEAEMLSDFSTSEANLKTAIGQLSDGGGTDMESGLASAQSLLAKEHADRQYIVLMSDGQPNDGKTGDELVSYAESIRDPDHDGRDDVIIYTLGFNEGLEGEGLLRSIASDGCYYSVRNLESLDVLGDFFQDIADSINGIKFMYARVACPVDVSVTFDGETLDSAGDNPKTRTSFGSLTFEEDEGSTSDDPVKVLRLREGQSYDISIKGTGFGTMDYSIGFIDDEGIYSDFRTFSGIDITENTAISTTAEAAKTTTLAVDEDGDGTVDKRYRARANQEGELVDSGWVVRSIVAVIAITILIVVGLLLYRMMKKHIELIDSRRLTK